MDKSEMLSMSDEDFLKLDSAPQVLSAEEQAAADAANPPATEEQPNQEPENQEAPETQEQPEENQEPETAEEPETPATPETPAAPTKPLDGKVTDQPKEPKAETPPAAAAEEIDYKARYEAMMKPLRANGKDIVLKSPEELIQLAQMGANYTRKMQEIAPHRKTLLTLEKYGLLDQGKLNFLIDLSQKNPAAIQKYLKESGVNLLDIDTEAEPTYRESNHQVSDEEANFRSVLDDLSASDVGRETLQAINSTWDQASKELLYTQPSIMQVMVEQKQAGFYDRIAAEVDRRRLLGQVPAGQTWLESYREVGQVMANSGAFVDLVAKEQQQPQNPAPAQAAPVATRTVQPKPQANERAKAAAASRTAATPAKTLVNPLALSDEEFLKTFENRL